MNARRVTFHELHLLGYGHFLDFTVELKPGLNVLYGPNEAGKSTVMTFVRDMLYGFPRKGGERDLTPRAMGGQYGGGIGLSAELPEGAAGARRRLEVRRLARRGRAEGELNVFGHDGQLLDAGVLTQALGGVGRALFGQVFAFTLDELQRFSQLTGEHDVSEALLVASLAGANRLPHANKALETELSAYGPRKSKAAINVELAKLERVREQLRELGDVPAQYAQAQHELSTVGTALVLAAQQRKAAQLKVAQLERLQQASPQLKRAVVAKSLLQQLPPAPAEAPAVLHLASSVWAQLSSAHGDAAALSQSLEANRLERAGLAEVAATENDARQLERALDEVKQASGALSSPADSERAALQLLERERAVSDRQQALERERADLKLAAEALEWPDPTEAMAHVVQLAQQQTSARGALAAVDEQVRGATAQLAALEGELAQGEGATAGHGLQGAGLQGAERWSQLDGGELKQLKARINEVLYLERASAEAPLVGPARAQAGQAFDPALAKTPIGLLVAASVVLGVGALLLALFASRPVLRVGAAAAVAAFACTSAMLALMRIVSARRRPDARDEAERERALAQAELSRRVTVARAEAGLLHGESAAAALESLERVLQQHLARKALLERADEVRRRIELQRGVLREATARAAELERTLDELARSLASVLGPLDERCGGDAAAAVPWLNRLQALRDAERAIATEAQACAAARGRLRQAAQALSRAAASCLSGAVTVEQGESVLGANALAELVARSTQWLAEYRTRRDRAAALDAQAETLKPGLLTAQQRAQSLEKELQASLAKVNATDLPHLKLLAEQATQRAHVSRELAEAVAHAEAILGSSVTLESLSEPVALLAEPAPTPSRPLPELYAEALAAPEALLDAQVSLQHAEREHQRLATEDGALRERLKRLAEVDRGAELRSLEAALAAEVSARLARWAAAVIAKESLERARAAIEQRHQPRVARYASEVFARLTDRRYVQVLPQVDSKLLVKDQHGRLWEPESLSRGTRELLFVALRLAVARGFGEDKVALPLLLDDVLVNFDSARAERLVAELATLAELGHQIIAFTCHPHLRTLFKGAGAHAVEVTTRAQLSLLASP